MSESTPQSFPEALEQIEQLMSAQKDLRQQNGRLNAIVTAYQNAFTGIMPALDAFPQARESIIKLKAAIERAGEPNPM